MGWLSAFHMLSILSCEIRISERKQSYRISVSLSILSCEISSAYLSRVAPRRYLVLSILSCEIRACGCVIDVWLTLLPFNSLLRDQLVIKAQLDLYFLISLSILSCEISHLYCAKCMVIYRLSILSCEISRNQLDKKRCFV